MITQNDIASMSEAELAVFVTTVTSPFPGFTPIFDHNGRFELIANSVLEKLGPPERAKLTIIGRTH